MKHGGRRRRTSTHPAQGAGDPSRRKIDGHRLYIACINMVWLYTIYIIYYVIWLYIYCIYVYIHISWYFIGFDSPFWPLFTAAKVKDQQGSEVQFKCLGCLGCLGSVRSTWEGMGWFLEGSHGSATWIMFNFFTFFSTVIINKKNSHAFYYYKKHIYHYFYTLSSFTHR